MRTEITYGDFHRVVETPPGIDFVGVTIRCRSTDRNLNCSTICFDDPEIGIYRTDEEITVDDATTVILHYYRMPNFADILAEFKAFEGMVFAEIENGDLHLKLTV